MYLHTLDRAPAHLSLSLVNFTFVEDTFFVEFSLGAEHLVCGFL